MEGYPSTTYRLRSLILILAMVVLTAIVLNLAPARVFAMEGYGVSIFPASTNEYPSLRSWFVYEADPGKEIKDKVLIKNHETRSMTLKIAVLDGAVTKDGGYTLVGGVEENKDLGTWATLSRDSVTLPPRSQQTIDLTVKVPANADVGSHPGGVVIWEDKTITDSTGAAQKRTGQLSVVTRVAARIYLTVPGDIVRTLRIENVHHTIYKGVLYFQMTMHNDGNVQLTPKADVKLRGIFGSMGEQLKSQFGMILRGGQINAKIPWQKKTPIFGRFVADFRIHYGEEDFKGEYVKDEYQDVRYVFWLIPWMTILWWAIGLALLLLVRKFWLWIMIRQRLNTKTREHTVKKGETLTFIAGIYNADPKKIAKFNLLKWPYDLMVGDVLLIPQGQLSKEERQYQKEHPELQAREARHSLLATAGHPGPTGRRPSSPALPVGRDSGSPGNRFRLGGRNDGRRIGRNDGSESGVEPVIMEAGDTVKTAAEFAGVSEKEIIKINLLKWPYRLRAGQELFIPVYVPRATNRPVTIKVKTAPKRVTGSRKNFSGKTSRLSKRKPKK